MLSFDSRSQQYGLVVVTGPETEPVTIDQLRAHLRLAEDSPDLAEVESTWLPAARETIEKANDLRFISQTVRLTVDRFPLPSCVPLETYPVVPAASWFEIPLRPVTAVNSIKYLDLEGVERTLSTSAYTVDVTRKTARVVLNQGYSWPSAKAAPGAIRVEFVAGWADVDALPATLRAAILWQTRSMFDGETELTADVERLVALHWNGGLDAKT